MIPDDVDVDALIARLSGPLQPADRAAFRAAAERVLEQLPCAGPGVAYRAVAALQRSFFDPPPDDRYAYNTGPRRRPSKLAAGPPIGADDPRGIGRRRRQFYGPR
jgi:hypothetical protein